MFWLDKYSCTDFTIKMTLKGDRLSLALEEYTYRLHSKFFYRLRKKCLTILAILLSQTNKLTTKANKQKNSSLPTSSNPLFSWVPL